MLRLVSSHNYASGTNCFRCGNYKCDYGAVGYGGGDMMMIVREDIAVLINNSNFFLVGKPVTGFVLDPDVVYTTTRVGWNAINAEHQRILVEQCNVRISLCGMLCLLFCQCGSKSGQGALASFLGRRNGRALNFSTNSTDARPSTIPLMNLSQKMLVFSSIQHRGQGRLV